MRLKCFTGRARRDAACWRRPGARRRTRSRFRLTGSLYGFHTPFYLGVERGYYKDEGIDLTIGEGQGSVRAVQTVGAKGDMFGLADGGSVDRRRVQGRTGQAVMAITNSSPYALAVRGDPASRRLKDVEGKTDRDARRARPACSSCRRCSPATASTSSKVSSCGSTAPARWWRSPRSAPRPDGRARQPVADAAAGKACR